MEARTSNIRQRWRHNEPNPAVSESPAEVPYFMRGHADARRHGDGIRIVEGNGTENFLNSLPGASQRYAKCLGHKFAWIRNAWDVSRNGQKTRMRLAAEGLDQMGRCRSSGENKDTRI